MLKKFDEKYDSIMSESITSKFSNRFYNVKAVSRGTPSIERIQEELLKLTKLGSWQDFLAEQKQNDCDLIAKAVSRMFPKVKMVSVIVKFSDQALEKMPASNTSSTCTHYLNKLNGKYLDFAKATNIYDGVYVLDGIDDINSCEYSDEATKRLMYEREEDPKQLGTCLRIEV